MSSNPSQHLQRAKTEAIPKLAWNDEAALQFAIKFVQMSPADAVREANNVHEVALRPMHIDGRNLIDRDTLLATQIDAKQFLFSAATEPLTEEFLYKVPLFVMRPSEAHRIKPLIAMVTDALSLRDMFIFRLYKALAVVGVERLRVCHAPRIRRPDDEICGRLFLKVTRKQYCTPQCEHRVRTRRWRRAR